MSAVSDDRALWLARHVLPHEPGLRDWLVRRGAQRQDVDDVVQEVYAVLASLHDVGHIREPRAYLYKAAQSVMLQSMRRARIVAIEMYSEFERIDVADEAATPERAISSQQELRLVGRLIERLPAQCREAFTLRRVEGLSQQEIAARMRLSENTVEKHICKGIRLLMESMKSAPAADAKPAPRRFGKRVRQHADPQS